METWPLWIVAAFMVLAAAINFRTLRVPNLIVIPAFLGGLTLGCLHSLSIVPDAGKGDLLSSLASGLSPLSIMVLAPGLVGVGSIKLQMAFGSWIGAFFPLVPGLVLGAFAMSAGTLCFGVMYPIYKHRTPLAVAQAIGSLSVMVAGWYFLS